MHAWGAASPRGLGRGATGAARRGHMGGSVFVAGIGSRRVSAAVHLRRDAGRAGQDRLDVRATWTWPSESGQHARRGEDEPHGPAVRRSVKHFGWHNGMLRVSPRRGVSCMAWHSDRTLSLRRKMNIELFATLMTAKMKGLWHNLFASQRLRSLQLKTTNSFPT